MKLVPYPSYKPIDLGWIAEIPSDWAFTPIKAMASCNDDVLPESTDAEAEIEYVDISSVHAVAGIVSTEFMTLGCAPSRARRKVQNGDVIVSTVRTYLRAITQIDKPSENLIVSTGFAVIRPQSIEPGFLGYLLRSEPIIGDVIARSTGVSYPAINACDLMSIKVPVPGKDVQAAIRVFLDRETAKIDALILEQQKLLVLLREKRQAVISHAVTKGIHPNVPMKGSGIDYLGEIPEHWQLKRLKQVAEVRGGVAKGKDQRGAKTVPVPYLRVANVQDGYLDLTEVAEIEVAPNELDRYLLQAGDVLMNEGGDYDKLGRGHIWQGEISPCIHQNHVFSVRPHSILSEWLASITSSDYAKFFFMCRANQSTNLASISLTNLSELPIPMPPESEQLEIRCFLERELAKVDILNKEAESTISLLQEHRTALISAVVTGKVDVREVACV